jgi:hypothetical protein
LADHLDPGTPQPSGDILVLEEVSRAPRETLDVARPANVARASVLDHLPSATDIGRDDGHARGKGFEGHSRYALNPRRGEQHVRSSQNARDLVVIDRAQEMSLTVEVA